MSTLNHCILSISAIDKKYQFQQSNTSWKFVKQFLSFVKQRPFSHFEQPNLVFSLHRKHLGLSSLWIGQCSCLPYLISGITSRKLGAFLGLLGEKLVSKLELVSFNAGRPTLFLGVSFAFFTKADDTSIINCVRVRFLSLLSWNCPFLLRIM